MLVIRNPSLKKTFVRCPEFLQVMQSLLNWYFIMENSQSWKVNLIFEAHTPIEQFHVKFVTFMDQ